MLQPLIEEHTGSPGLGVPPPIDCQVPMVNLRLPEGNWPLELVHNHGLDFAVPSCIGTWQDCDAVLHHLPPRKGLLLLGDVGAVIGQLPVQASLIGVEDLLLGAATLLNQILESFDELVSSFLVGTGSLSMALDMVELVPALKAVEPPIAGCE